MIHLDTVSKTKPATSYRYIIDLRERTMEYIRAFNSREISQISTILDNKFCLTDPSVKAIGKEEVRRARFNITFPGLGCDQEYFPILFYA
jgi:hypothetical protein